MKQRIPNIDNFVNEAFAKPSGRNFSAIEEVRDMFISPKEYKIHPSDVKLMKEISQGKLQETVIDDGGDTCIVMYRNTKDYMAQEPVYFIYHNSNYEPEEMMKITKVKIR